MGANLAESDFFNANTREEACRELDEMWPTRHRRGKNPETGETNDIRQCARIDPKLWVGSKHGGHLGIRPLLWTLQILSRYNNLEKVTVNSLAPVEADIWFTEGANNQDGSAQPNPKAVKNTLARMIRKDLSTPGYKPELNWLYFNVYARKLVNSWYARMGLEPPSLEELIAKIQGVWRTLNDDAVTSVVSALNIIETLLPDTAEFVGYTGEKPVERDFSKGNHLIPPDQWKYVDGEFKDRDNPAKPKKKADEIISYLASKKGVMLCGNVNAGKSSVIVEILRSLKRGAVGNNVCLRVVGADLPVCVINARRHSGKEVALQALAFLENQQSRYNAKSYDKILADLRAEFHSEDRTGELVRIHKRLIEACARASGFFIFTNWDENGESAPRSMMRDQSKAALIRLLYQGNMDNRILLSTLGAEKSPDKRSRSTLPEMKRVELVDPVFSQVRRYWPGLDVANNEQRKVVDALEAHIGDKKQIPGAHLMLIAVLIQLVGGRESVFESREALAKLNIDLVAYADAVLDTTGKRKARLNEAVRPLIRALLAELNRQNLLRIVLAIASSDDGLRPKSLEDVVKTWATQSGISLFRKNPVADIREHLLPCAAGFFVLEVPSVDRNAAQLDLREKVGPDDKQFELNQTLREMIFDEVFAPENVDLRLEEGQPTCREWAREAQRHVAIRSRRRGRNWRSHAPMSTLTRNWRDLLPDIQAYESLLASLDPQELENGPVQQTLNAALVHYEPQVFRQDKGYDTTLAFRFAVNCLLRKEIDHGGRLSMLYDQDSLRTKLCVLPFLELGRKHFVRAMELGKVADLPRCIPNHVRRAFSPTEITEMLTSVALAAFHSQCTETVVWAKRMFDCLLDEVAETSGRSWLFYRGTRIVCSAFDLSLLQGGPVWFSSNTPSSHLDTLSLLRAFISDEFGELDAVFGDASLLGYGDAEIENGVEVVRRSLKARLERTVPNGLLRLDREMIIAWLRLKAREAALLDCVGRKKNALALYDALHRIEALLEAEFGESGAFVLDGRPARHEIMALLTSPDFRASKQGPASAKYTILENRVVALLQANTSRLSRFGGAEQAATLVSWAMYHAMRKAADLEMALEFATQARNAVENDQASLAMHVQILSVQIYLKILCLKIEVESGKKDALLTQNMSLLRDADSLIRLAENGLSHRPMAGRAYSYRATILKMMARIGVGDVKAAAIEADLQRSREFLKDAHHFLYEAGQSRLALSLCNVC